MVQSDSDNDRTAHSIALADTLDPHTASWVVKGADHNAQTPDRDLLQTLSGQVEPRPADPIPLQSALSEGLVEATADGFRVWPKHADEVAKRMLGALDATSRRAVALQHHAGCNYGRIGVILGLAPDEVTATLARAEDQLAATLSAHELGQSDCGYHTQIGPYLDGELEPHQATAIESHAESCATCKHKLGFGASFRNVIKRGLHALAHPLAGTVGNNQQARMPELGESFAGYRILEILGRGGMGTVFKAEQTVIGRNVAVKVLAPHLATNRSQVERFLREARASGRLDHPNVVRTLDAGEADGIYYHVMEHVAGGSARDHLRNHGPMPPEQALAVVEGVAHALVLAEEHGIVHRDIKPANIMLDARTGQPKLADLGLARFIANEETREALTVTGAVMGTPAYMPPEQIRNTRTADRRSDIYSLGVSFFQMLTNALPFSGDTPVEVISAVLEGEVAMPAHANWPPGFEDLLLTMTRSDPALRYQSAEHLLADIHCLTRDRPMSFARSLHAADTGMLLRAGTRVGNPSGVAPQPATRNKLWLGAKLAGALALTCLAVAAGMFLWNDYTRGTNPSDSPQATLDRAAWPREVREPRDPLPNSAPRSSVPVDSGEVAPTNGRSPGASAHPLNRQMADTGRELMAENAERRKIANDLAAYAHELFEVKPMAQEGFYVALRYDFVDDGPLGVPDFERTGFLPPGPAGRRLGSTPPAAQEHGSMRSLTSFTLETKLARGFVLRGNEVWRWRPLCQQVKVEIRWLAQTGDNMSAVFVDAREENMVAAMRHTVLPQELLTSPYFNRYGREDKSYDRLMHFTPHLGTRIDVVEATSNSTNDVETYFVTFSTGGRKNRLQAKALVGAGSKVEGSTPWPANSGRFGLSCPWGLMLVKEVIIEAVLDPAWVEEAVRALKRRQDFDTRER